MQMNEIFKEFENISVEKRRFRLRWDSSPDLFSTERFSNSLNKYIIFIFVINSGPCHDFGEENIGLIKKNYALLYYNQNCDD